MTSCNDHDHEEIQKLRTDYERLLIRTDSISTTLDSVTLNFVEPFEQYQQIVLNEKESNPDSTIKAYEELIRSYPNSFWSYEANKRKNAIHENRKYWYDGEWHTNINLDDMELDWNDLGYGEGAISGKGE